MNSTEHEPAESVQDNEVNVPEEVRANSTLPAGTEPVPLTVSATVAMHLLFVFTGRVPGEQTNLTDVA